MTKRPNIVVHTDPAASMNTRAVELGRRPFELVPARNDWSGALSWKRAGLFDRTWTLEAAHGTLVVLYEANLLRRVWRAESASEGWTLTRSWRGTTTLTDDHDARLLQFRSGWLGRGRIEPASGPELEWRRDWFRGHVVDDLEGQRMVELVRSPGFLTRTTNVTLSDAVRERADLLPLLALTWLVTLSARHRHAH